ncbi:hypothetical protein G4B88_024369 [Cannabis sativa]|uniref:Pectate lyase N-terminal domain-containing protein n=1 Tax=Cannabis sativa TaxID=3483 RepID=A0A7J6H540_CANSA|nr:hypothetical protein G4B88_024369 [Cannabis sativa]
MVNTYVFFFLTFATILVQSKIFEYDDYWKNRAEESQKYAIEAYTSNAQIFDCFIRCILFFTENSNRVRIVTGDNLQTAKAITLERGILNSMEDATHPTIIEGKDFHALSERELEQIAKKITLNRKRWLVAAGGLFGFKSVSLSPRTIPMTSGSGRLIGYDMSLSTLTFS